MAKKFKVATEFTANDKGVIGAFKRMGRQASAFEKKSKNAFGRASQAGSRTGDVIKGIIGADLISRGIQLAGSVVRITGEFERFNAVLKNTLGSQEAASAAMEDIQKFAATTPFQLNELVGSYLKLTNRGMQPTMETMRKLGDIAASQGKSFDQLTEAILDATSGGGFERLKEFGIKASKNAGMVEFSFKGMTKRVADTPHAINEALLAFADLEGVAGGMDAISQTLEGRISNLQDSFATLAVKLGKSLLPIMEGAINLLLAMSPVLEQMIPLLPVIAGGWLAYNAALRAQMAMGFLQHAFKFVRVMTIMARQKGILTAAQWLWNRALMANPIGLIIAGVTALIAVGVLLVKNWDRITAAISAAWNRIKEFVSGSSVIARVLQVIFAPIIAIIKGVKFLAGKVGGFLGGGKEAPNAQQANAKAGRGQVDVNFNNAPTGTTAKTTRQNNLKINPNMVGQNP